MRARGSGTRKESRSGLRSSMHVYCYLDRVVRGAAGRNLLVVSSSNGGSILGAEQEHLNQGVAEEEEAVEMPC